MTSVDAVRSQLIDLNELDWKELVPGEKRMNMAVRLVAGSDQTRLPITPGTSSFQSISFRSISWDRTASTLVIRPHPRASAGGCAPGPHRRPAPWRSLERPGRASLSLRTPGVAARGSGPLIATLRHHVGRLPVRCRRTPDWLIEAFEGGEEPSTPAAGTVVEP